MDWTSLQQNQRRYYWQQRRGISLVYVGIAIIMLVGFLALAADMGRVRVSKTQLQIAADAGARASAWLVKPNLPDHLTEAQDRAINTVAQNVCDWSAISLDRTQDIQFGRWNPFTRTVTAMTPERLAMSNAVRVMTRRIQARSNPIVLWFAPVIGTDQVDVEAEAVALKRGGTYQTGLIGIDSVSLNGVTSTDSYNSSDGFPYPYPYDELSPGQEGSVATNGPLTLVGNATVNGYGYYWDYLPDVTSNAGATQGFEQLAEPMEFPPVDPTEYESDNSNATLPPAPTGPYDASTRDFILRNKESYTLQGDTGADTTQYVRYYFRDFSMGAQSQLTITGRVEICVTGSCTLNGGVTTYNQTPGNFRLRMAGDGPLAISGHSDLYADVYCPEAPATFNGLGNPKDPLALFGAIVAKSLTVHGNSDLHYDESLGNEFSQPYNVVLVK